MRTTSLLALCLLAACTSPDPRPPAPTPEPYTWTAPQFALDYAEALAQFQAKADSILATDRDTPWKVWALELAHEKWLGEYDDNVE